MGDAGNPGASSRRRATRRGINLSLLRSFPRKRGFILSSIQNSRITVLGPRLRGDERRNTNAPISPKSCANNTVLLRSFPRKRESKSRKTRSSRQLVSKVFPGRIESLDQFDLPGSIPFLKLALARERGFPRLMLLVPNELLDAVFLREARNDAERYLIRSFPRKRESKLSALAGRFATCREAARAGRNLGPRFRGDERRIQTERG
jgi:hypothetical protein